MMNMESLANVGRDRQEEAVPIDQLLPLVIEIIPGQASEGLLDIYEPGSFEEKPLRELIEKTLGKGGWSIEEQQILEDIKRQLSGGKILWRGREIGRTALAHAVLEQSESGEKYLYVPVRVIRPQEGGGRFSQKKDRRRI